MKLMINFINKKISLSIHILIITLFSLIVFPGYEVFISDHEFYLTKLFQHQNPSLYSKDFTSLLTTYEFNFFNILITFLQRILKIDIFSLLFLFSFIVRYIYYYSIYKLFLYFSKNRSFSYFSLLIFIPGFTVYGYPYSTVDTILLPRSIGLSLNLLFLVLFFYNKRPLSLVVLIIGLLIYPILSPFSILFLILYLLLSHKISGKSFWLIVIAILSFVILTIFINGTNLISSIHLYLIDKSWEEIIKSRSPSYFVSSWNYQITMLMASFFLFLIVIGEAKNLLKERCKRLYIYLLFLLPFAFLIIHVVSVEWMKILFGLQIQILRSISFWKIFSILLFTIYAYKKIKNNPYDLLTNFLLVGMVISFIFDDKFIFPLPVKGSLLLIFLPIFIPVWLAKRFRIIKFEKTTVIQKILFIITFALASFIVSRLFIIRLAILIPLFLITLVVTILIYCRMKTINKYSYLYTPASIIILTVSVLLSVPKFKITPVYYENHDFMQACNWIKNNINQEAVFVTEPFSIMGGPLKLSCYINIFSRHKEGSAIILFSREGALEWKKRMELLNNLKENHHILTQILNQYKIDYIFSDYKLNISYPEVFSNQKYFIYKL